MKMNLLDWITWILVIIGALNWGLIGFFHFNLVEHLFGASMVSSVIYDLVGLSALYVIFACFKHCKA